MSEQQPATEKSANPIKIAIWVAIGALALVIGLLMLAQFAVSGHTLGASNEGATTDRAVSARIAPLTQLAVAPGGAASTKAVAAPAPVTVPVAAVAIPVAAIVAPAHAGAGVYTKACAACHAGGIAGAPKSGDKAAWAARIAQGKPTLYEHAIKGYQGKGGVMPAKGGYTNLSDGDVQAAVDYMVALNK